MRRSFWSSQRISAPAALVAAFPEEPHERRLEVALALALRRVQLGRRPGEDEVTVGQHEHAIGPALGLGDVVRAEDDRRAGPREARDPVPQTLALARVQRRARLVEQQDRRGRGGAPPRVYPPPGAPPPARERPLRAPPPPPLAPQPPPPPPRGGGP